jgi:hypothetical protein
MKSGRLRIMFRYSLSKTALGWTLGMRLDIILNAED